MIVQLNPQLITRYGELFHMLKKIWADPVWSKVIANGIWAAGGIVIAAVITYLLGWRPNVLTLAPDIRSLISSFVVTSSLIPNWLFTPICLLAAFGVFMLSKALYRHIAGQDSHNHQHNILRIVPLGNSFYWNSAKWYDQPATFLSGTWYFTNVTNHPLYLAAAYIKSPRKARIHAERMPEYVLQPEARQSIRVNFFPYPAVHREGKPFKATVVFVDHYGNKHVLKNILFKVPAHVLFPLNKATATQPTVAATGPTQP